MYRKWVFAALAALLLVSALAAGCAAQKSDSQSPAAEKSLTDTGYEAPAAEEGLTPPQGSETLPLPDMSAAAGKKIIYTADMSLEAKDTAAAIDAISAKAVELGGYVSDSRYEEASRNASSSVTIRIPPERYKELTMYVGTLGKVLSLSLSSQDVTDQYYDIEARLRNAQAQEAQLLKIMEQAVEIEDILKVRGELNGVQEEIEVLQGQMRLMENQIGYSTVRIAVWQTTPPSIVAEDEGVKFWGFEAVGGKIVRGFVDGFNWTLNALSGILMVLSYILFPLLLVAAAVFLIVLVVRLAIKRKKAK